MPESGQCQLCLQSTPITFHKPRDGHKYLPSLCECSKSEYNVPIQTDGGAALLLKSIKKVQEGLGLASYFWLPPSEFAR